MVTLAFAAALTFLVGWALKLGNSLKEISDYAFSGCKINNLDVPKSVKRIGKYGVSGIFYNVKINGALELDTCAIGAYDQIYNLEGQGSDIFFTPQPNASLGETKTVSINTDTEIDYTVYYELNE